MALLPTWCKNRPAAHAEGGGGDDDGDYDYAPAA